eukprot:UN24505
MTLLVNLHLPTYIPISGFDTLWTAGYLGDEALWYTQVCNAMITTMIISIFNPSFVPLLLMPFEKRNRNSAIKKVATQEELNEAWEGQEFSLAERYSVLCMKIVVCVMLSPMLPVLWLILAAISFGTYFFNKIQFLRISRIPPMYDETLAKMSIDMCFMGVKFHAVIAIWLYGFATIKQKYLIEGDIAGCVSILMGDYIIL